MSFSKFSTQEYHNKAKFNSMWTLQQKWMDKDQAIQRINMGMPTFKTANLLCQNQYLAYFLQHLGMMLEFYQKHHWKRLWFKLKAGQQHALALMTSFEPQ
ncbi:hypothetical protein M427DRAFT_28206 [Gonapodya prolifera JEL478]|uniref:Uncharacterized protein n=1 Tax=Gonapodya prolifera (strain JEL478) TaxID=1344416 RepID=A0A139AV89_GONPJ|nr:hypothetical protein M427DRAFT_28206 [Gonapodya prolifera JEL478]|eukprot:KXS20493.1 hypothetical protein M427DRAFT_28206 [Gonapodya prolifera JEL478]